MDLATSASDTAAVSTDYVNHGQEDGKQTSFAAIFLMYSDDIVSTCNLRSVISDMFFG